MNGHSLKTMTPYNNQQESYYPLQASAAACFFSIFSQPTLQVTNSIQENPLRHPQQPTASGEGNIRIPLHHLVGSCSGYLLIPYFCWRTLILWVTASVTTLVKASVSTWIKFGLYYLLWEAQVCWWYILVGGRFLLVGYFEPVAELWLVARENMWVDQF